LLSNILKVTLISINTILNTLYIGKKIPASNPLKTTRGSPDQGQNLLGQPWPTTRQV